MPVTITLSGPQGSGKTTTARLIARVLAETGAKVVVGTMPPGYPKSRARLAHEAALAEAHFIIKDHS